MFMTLCTGCKEKASSYQVAHVSSPNGSLEAVLTETNGGATTSFGYEVSVGPKGSKGQEKWPASMVQSETTTPMG